jgi:hypothetical protein
MTSAFESSMMSPVVPASSGGPPTLAFGLMYFSILALSSTQ